MIATKEKTFTYDELVKLKQSVRKSGYGDYIALDFIDETGKIISTPFYISNGKSVEVHWGWPSSERAINPVTYDEWYERYLFKMKKGILTCAWLNGPCPTPTFTKVNPEDLVDWKFKFAHKIINK